MRRLRAVLDREDPPDLLAGLRDALRQRKHEDFMNPGAAYLIDTKAVFEIAKSPTSSDTLDYLTTKHVGPIVMPAQVINEYWNNRVREIDSPVDPVLRRLAELEKEVEKFGVGEFSPYRSQFDAILLRFREEFVAVLDPAHAGRVDAALDQISTVASVPALPRGEFDSLAVARKHSKTPPGFKDGLAEHGDFYVWAEGLYGLLRKQRGRARGSRFTQLVVITNDQKKDWSVAGSLHPVLRAEARKLLGVDADTWTAAILERYVRERSQGVVGRAAVTPGSATAEQ